MPDQEMIYFYGTQEFQTLFFQIIKSLETLNYHQIVHNDIKPQNYLVKFLNGLNDLTRIDIVLTDFGLVGQNSKGGTPIFACPECFDVKTNASDIFSLGRVFLFMMLPKESFLTFLFVPITSSADKNYLVNLTDSNLTDLLCLIKQFVIQINPLKRISLGQLRYFFDILTRTSVITMNSPIQTEIERVATLNITPKMFYYVQDLNHVS